MSEAHMIPIPKSTQLELAATLSTSPPTAYRLLSDFVSLSPGDVVVHNNAASSVGTALVQIAKAFGLRTISLLPDSSSEYAATVERLKLMGSDVVVSESFGTSSEFKAILGDLPSPKLGINSSSSESCGAVATLTRNGGVVVTHCPGISNSSAIKSSGCREANFSLPSWLDRSNRADVTNMVGRLISLVEEGKLRAWLQRVPFEDLQHAIKLGGGMRRKLVAMMSSA